MVVFQTYRNLLYSTFPLDEGGDGIFLTIITEKKQPFLTDNE